MEKSRKNLREITSEEFHNLKPGDKVYINLRGERPIESKVVRAPFYNYDADEPGWEVETNNGYSDENSLCVDLEDKGAVQEALDDMDR